MNCASSKYHHRITLVFVSILLAMPLLLVPFVSHAGGGGGGGAGGESADPSLTSLGGDGGTPPMEFTGDPVTCAMGFAYDAGSNSCVATGYCGDYYYWNGSSCQDCNADVSTQYQTLSCPAGQTGSISQQRTSHCQAPTAGPQWPGWTTTSNTCTTGCTPEVQTQTLSCPSGQSGSIERARASWCPGPQWTEWFETNTCTGAPPPPYAEGAYPPPYAEGAYPPPYAEGAYPPPYAEGAYPPPYGQGSYPPTNPTVTGTPTTVTSGGTVIITWSDPLGRSCNGIGFSAGGASSGTVTVNPSATSDFGVQCGTGRTVVTITVTNPVLTIGAAPARVRSGSASSITWSATSVNSCTLTGTGINTSCSGSACGNPHSNSTGALSAQTVYMLACQTGAGSRSATATVFITPTVCEVGTVGCPDN